MAFCFQDRSLNSLGGELVDALFVVLLVIVSLLDALKRVCALTHTTHLFAGDYPEKNVNLCVIAHIR